MTTYKRINHKYLIDNSSNTLISLVGRIIKIDDNLIKIMTTDKFPLNIKINQPIKDIIEGKYIEIIGKKKTDDLIESKEIISFENEIDDDTWNLMIELINRHPIIF